MPDNPDAPGPRPRRAEVVAALTLSLAVGLLSAQQPAPRRVVSLIPAVTQILFAIGAGPQIVAVSSFDDYPPEVSKLQRVGALLDPDLERILSLEPDMVAVYGSQTDLRAQLARARVPTYVYSHAGLADVTTTIQALGDRVGHAAEAAALVRQIQDGLADVRRRVAGRPRPRTLLVFARESGSLRGIYASGGIGFLHDMLEAAGGVNVFADVKRESVQATTELILARRPDVILEVRADRTGLGPLDAERTEWSRLPGVAAVRNNRVVFIVDPRTVVPGPRVAEGTRLIAEALHPGAFR
jgi:iron complex transport system substrate-binding protein